MRYKLDDLNTDQVLGRSEMKKIMAGSGDDCRSVAPDICSSGCQEKTDGGWWKCSNCCST